MKIKCPRKIRALNWCMAILGNNTSFVFSFVAIFVSQERFLLWKMTREHLTDCERNMSHNMSQEVLGSIGKYFHPSSFLNLNSSTFTQVIRYSSLSSRRFLFSNMKHEVKCVEYKPGGTMQKSEVNEQNFISRIGCRIPGLKKIRSQLVA